MKHPFLLVCSLLVSCLALGQTDPRGGFVRTSAATTPGTGTETRLALVIGNSKYTVGNPLPNATNDANDMAAKLAEIGFVVRPYIDLNYQQMRRALADFGEEAAQYKVIMIFYAGHGIGYNNTNYLVPVDATLTKESYITAECISVNDLLTKIGHESEVSVVILDACRNNPFERNWAVAGRDWSGGRGLAVQTPPTGTMIIFATQPGSTASENEKERNGLFTKYVLQHIGKEGQSLDQLFDAAGRSVMEVSGRAQTPYKNATPGVGSYCLVPKTKIDADDDGVPDSFDKCPNEPGTECAAGCPDHDGDCLTEKYGQDQCPDAKGTPAFDGCPDTDGDGIPDHKDACAKEAGDRAHNGCPPPPVIPTQPVVEPEKKIDSQPAATSFAPEETQPTDTQSQAPLLPQEAVAAEIAMLMVRIPGGTYQMGSKDYDDEKPIHSVTVSDFWLSQTEVTQAQYREIMGSNHSGFRGCPTCPVERVSWDDAQAFIQKLNTLTGKSYRLPTEAEWEYAAGGGSGSRTIYAGTSTESTLSSFAWYDANSDSKTHPVKTKSPNALGLYDMSGNVWEWCQDWYGAYRKGAQTNPTGPATGSSRVCRGGSWNYSAVGFRVAYRFNRHPGYRYDYLGFRLARTGE